MYLVVFIIQVLSLFWRQANIGAVTETDVLNILVLGPLGND